MLGKPKHGGFREPGHIQPGLLQCGSRGLTLSSPLALTPLLPWMPSCELEKLNSDLTLPPPATLVSQPVQLCRQPLAGQPRAHIFSKCTHVSPSYLLMPL